MSIPLTLINEKDKDSLQVRPRGPKKKDERARVELEWPLDHFGQKKSDTNRFRFFMCHLKKLSILFYKVFSL